MSVKFYYFDARGIAEPIRMIFAVGGIEYEDIRAPVDITTVPTPLPAEIKESKRILFSSVNQNGSSDCSYISAIRLT
jgi:hypothetical protein